MRSNHGLWRAVLMAVPVGLLVAACGDSDTRPSVAFSQPADGADLAGGVVVAMTADGLTIEEAGTVHGGAGHFHVIAE
ncbi:MAG: hypothetical protein ACRDPR_12610 [Nocardioidaceae bacterium]